MCVSVESLDTTSAESEVNNSASSRSNPLRKTFSHGVFFFKIIEILPTPSNLPKRKSKRLESRGGNDKLKQMLSALHFLYEFVKTRLAYRYFAFSA